MRSCNYTLSPTRINNTKAKRKLFKLSDGGGLFIEVSPGGVKTWRYQYRFGGARKELTIGKYPEVGVADGTVVLPNDERVFNPSRETRHILKQADAIGADAARLCQLLFAIEGRVGQRKLWGIVHLAERYPRQMVNAACAQALDNGVRSYRHVKAVTEQLVADALRRMDSAEPASNQASNPAHTQAHDLIRSPQEYGELFALASACKATTTELTPQGDLFA